MENLYVGIIAGGKGERFWPLSRTSKPKQFLSLFSEEPLLKVTYERACSLVDRDRVCIVATRAQADRIQRVLPDATVLAEPEGKNTAPAMALASKWGYDRDPDAIVLLLPADHVIGDPEAFSRDVAFAAEVAKDGYLTTFGIVPSRVETGYGHIQRGKSISERGEQCSFRVLKFHEKPKFEIAQKYTKSKEFYWNSGMFIWRASAILASISEHFPEFHHALMKESLDSDKGLEAIYKAAPRISIDYGIMEKTDRAAVVEATFSWEDVGSFWALERVLPIDDSGNVKRGDVLLKDSDGVVAWAEDGLVAAYGVKDLVVVHTKDVTLVLPKKESQRVRDLLDVVKESKEFEKYWE
jgi:mannose-1-phosphate guanylyltransferase/mannose-6-phosphate isomerase